MNALLSLFTAEELEEIYNKKFNFVRNKYSSWTELREKKIIVFGAGLYGQNIISTLQYNGIFPYCCIDSDDRKVGNKVLGVSVEPTSFLEQCGNALVILTSAYALEMKNICKNYNVETILPLELPEAEAPYPPIGHLIDDYKDNGEFEKFIQMLDAESLFVIKNFLLFQFTLDMSYIRRITTLPPYFTKEFSDKIDYSVFCDLGASIGDTLNDFLSYTECGSKKQFIYYAFEPDCESYKVLERAIQGVDNVYAFNVAVGKYDEIKSFFGNGIESSLYGAAKGNVREVHTLCLDNFFKDKTKPTAIKLDVEGAELDVLEGCKQLIRTHVPNLIISVYHRQEDFYKLPLYINSLSTKYIFHIRQHSSSYGELVLYAIAKK